MIISIRPIINARPAESPDANRARADSDDQGVGSGGSVGGQRSRNNIFMVDSVDNNRKEITGPAIYISPEPISEFTLLQNQFSAEFECSTGGQFLVVTKSGTNEFHVKLYEFPQKRHLNALDILQKDRVFSSHPRNIQLALRFNF